MKFLFACIIGFACVMATACAGSTYGNVYSHPSPVGLHLVSNLQPAGYGHGHGHAHGYGHGHGHGYGHGHGHGYGHGHGHGYGHGHGHVDGHALALANLALHLPTPQEPLSDHHHGGHY